MPRVIDELEVRLERVSWVSNTSKVSKDLCSRFVDASMNLCGKDGRCLGFHCDPRFVIEDDDPCYERERRKKDIHRRGLSTPALTQITSARPIIHCQVFP